MDTCLLPHVKQVLHWGNDGGKLTDFENYSVLTQVWEGKEGITSILDVRCRSSVEINAY